MRVRIHRGSVEIGGNCVELENDGASILLDLGEPLMGDEFGDQALPDVAGLADGSNPNLLGIVISHPHLDHYGLVQYASPKIRKYMGRDAATLLKAASAFTPTVMNFENVQHYRDGQPFDVGPFRITPFIADHSAFDAYSLLVEASSKRLFYSGDLRGHGWKSWAFERLLSDPPQQVDAMLLEGTTLSREDGIRAISESELAERLTDAIRCTDGIVLAAFSGQNIDRLVTFYKATKKAGRTFVADCYIAHLLHSIGRSTLPNPASDAMRVFLPKRMKRNIIRNKRFDVVEPFRNSRIYPEQIENGNSKLVATFRASMAEDFEKPGVLDGGRLIYSMWPGYLERGSPNLRQWCVQHGVEFEIHHTSGHADQDDLARIVEAIKPKILLPIHTLSPERYGELGASVSFAANNRWCDIH